MAKKKKNAILEEQKKARQAFLELKKMQEGSMNPEPKPSEVAINPKTFKEKRENFWFHYKWHTIGIAATVITLIILVAQCMSVPKYDFMVVYFGYTTVLDNQTELIADYFEKIGKDINGDGEVNIQVVNCSFNNDNNDVQYRQAQLQKMQAMLAGEYKAMLYITDEESIKYFDNISSDKKMFEEEPLKLNDEFYKATRLEEIGDLPEGLQISCRRIKDTVLEDNETATATYKESQRIMKELENKAE